MSDEARKRYQREYYLKNRAEFLARSKARYAANRDEIRGQAKERYRNGDFDAYMLDRARQRARKLGREFTITVGDIQIPEFCPVFGMKLERNFGGKGHSPASPSLDRIDSRKGYVPGNVQVISMKANLMKGDATPEELARFASWISADMNVTIEAEPKWREPQPGDGPEYHADYAFWRENATTETERP